jgi:hypothetical protein
VHSLASIEQRHGEGPHATEEVRTVRLDSLVHEPVAFVKIDVEGHELRVLNGATGVLERSKPVFLVEAEERHRPGTTASVFEFFTSRGYDGFFILGDAVKPVSAFEPAALQDTDALVADGGRKEGRWYVNNFFFFPRDADGQRVLTGGLQASLQS